MSLKEQLQEDMKAAMKAKDKDRLTLVRGLKSAVMNEEIELNHDLTPDEELTVVSREVKQQKDSLAEFKAANRQDLVDQVQKQLDILAEYMPKQLSADEIKTIIQKAIEQTGASAPSDMGKVMGVVSGQVKGKADGKTVANEVKAMLAAK
ncbi:GatB/YqeY domain-containing protein [Eupransor demetentiae]|uniref:May have tRNA amino acid amidase activity (YqeY) n=1 Tax=Eupransor demetentiae TaxID=3109584 RepID=A0ABM9N4E1_9LACO|nr:Uncharacterized conserved protein YqeY [Lactobacillaceae bacterium LMG 33000]